MEFHVSVPFPGILFLNIIGNNIYKAGCDAFPSPSRGSYFSIHRRTPDGKTINVSVPFPGILFLNKRSNILMAVPPSCFRPLPGDLISQFPPTAKRCATCFVFPSPSRGSYFSITYDEFKVLQVCYEFPSPSRGSYFSIIFQR